MVVVMEEEEEGEEGEEEDEAADEKERECVCVRRLWRQCPKTYHAVLTGLYTQTRRFALRGP